MMRDQPFTPRHSGGPGRPGRRLLLGAGIGTCLIGLAPPAAAAAVIGDWLNFRRRFLRDDGRVLDTGQGGISHSEGQGAALLCAVRFDDRPSFDRILAWTRGALRRPDDQLLAWAWRPGAPIPVPDLNNATQGDLLVAWALAEASERWAQPDHRALARQMARDLLRRTVLEQGDMLLLLPGAEGFLKPDHVVVNPGYYMPSAFRALARLAPAPQWRRLEEEGVALADRARFGRWRLTPDWVALSRGVARPMPAPGWPARFAGDALRVPLHLAWGGHTQSAALRAAVAFWRDPGHAAPPAWADLRSSSVAPYAGDSGLRAVAQFAAAMLDGEGREESMPGVAEAPAYESAMLTLQARLAWAERRLTPLAPGQQPAAPAEAGRGSAMGWLRGMRPQPG